jgi:hypothetical protein
VQRAALIISLLINVALLALFVVSRPVPTPSSSHETTPPTGSAKTPPPQTQSVATPAPQANGSNLIWPSEGFSGPNWNAPENASLANDAGSGPTGKTDASRLTEDTHNGRHRIEGKAGQLRPNTVYTLSVYVKAAERTGFMLEMRDFNQVNSSAVVYDLLHHTATSIRGDIRGVGMEDAGNGWVRCWAALPFASDQAVFDLAILGPPDDAPTYSGDGKSGLLIWGAQLEPFPAPGQYVPTTNGPVLPH